MHEKISIYFSTYQLRNYTLRLACLSILSGIAQVISPNLFVTDHPSISCRVLPGWGMVRDMGGGGGGSCWTISDNIFPVCPFMPLF